MRNMSFSNSVLDYVLLVLSVDANDCMMLPKRQKLIQAKSASVDLNSNHSIVSMFARQQSRNQLQNVQPDSQHMINQITDLSEVTDRRRLDNRLSLSLRRKRLHSDTVIIIADDTDSNNAVDISEPLCTVLQSSDIRSDSTNGRQNESLSSASPPLNENCRDTVSLVSDNQQSDSDFTINQEDALITDENSVSDLLPVGQSASEAVVVHVPYYLENFLLVLDSVFSDTFYAELFNDDDLSALHTFKSLSGNFVSDALNSMFFKK